MPYETYRFKNLRDSSLKVIAQANQIIAMYAEHKLTLTLRQLYYQFVARDLLANKQQNYDRLGYIISDGRLAGLIDWDAIEDRNRAVVTWRDDHDPEIALGSLASRYSIDLWQGQDYYVEVWVEKEALAGVVQQACGPLYTRYLACRGYTSQSEMWRASKRFIAAERRGQSGVILHLGDHDPSGIDMSRDIEDRITMFCRDGDGATCDPPIFERLALNIDQVRRYNPPPNPAKMTDSRAPDYVRQYGRSSWELDALDPTVLNELISSNIRNFLDEDLFNERVEQRDLDRERLRYVSNNWDDLMARRDDEANEE